MDKFVKPSPQAYYKRDSGKCVTFSLSDFFSIRQVLIRSPVPVTVYLHGKNQFYSSELRSSMTFTEENSYIVRVEKVKNMPTKEASCYEGNFDDYILGFLEKQLMDKFKCTVPFLPPRWRQNAPICVNSTVGKQATDMYYASPIEALNLWSRDQELLPPCEFFRYKPEEQFRSNATEHKVWIKKNQGLHLIKSNTDKLWISFVSEMIVTEQVWTYTFLAYIAENGGFVGLFLGYSVLNFGDFFKSLADFHKTRVS